jgi:hypothetical protein
VIYFTFDAPKIMVSSEAAVQITFFRYKAFTPAQREVKGTDLQ